MTNCTTGCSFVSLYFVVHTCMHAPTASLLFAAVESTYSSIQPYLAAAPPRPPEQTVRNKWGRTAYLPGAELKGERRCLGQAFFHLCSGICGLLSRTPILPTSWSSRAVAFCLGKIAYCLLYDTFICVRKFVALHILEGSKENGHVVRWEFLSPCCVCESN